MELDREIVSKGAAIEEESFKIIDEEIGEHNFDKYQWPVVRRVIHATGDFEFAKLIRFHPLAIEKAIEAIKRSSPVFVDTRMIASGLSPWKLSWFNNEVRVPVSLPEAKEMAERLNITRSAAAFRYVASELNDSIILIGNAPTALLEVIALFNEGIAKPSVVVGVPVGFVQAEESKEYLFNIEDLPSITVKGRKGGSAVAVSIFHALLELAKRS